MRLLLWTWVSIDGAVDEWDGPAERNRHKGPCVTVIRAGWWTAQLSSRQRSTSNWPWAAGHVRSLFPGQTPSKPLCLLQTTLQYTPCLFSLINTGPVSGRKQRLRGEHSEASPLSHCLSSKTSGVSSILESHRFIARTTMEMNQKTIGTKQVVAKSTV